MTIRRITKKLPFEIYNVREFTIWSKYLCRTAMKLIACLDLIRTLRQKNVKIEEVYYRIIGPPSGAPFPYRKLKET